MSKTRQEKKSDQIEITDKDGDELFERLESKSLTEQDYEILKWFLRTFFKLCTDLKRDFKSKSNSFGQKISDMVINQ